MTAKNLHVDQRYKHVSGEKLMKRLHEYNQ